MHLSVSTGQLCEWTERLGRAGGSRARFPPSRDFPIISTQTMRPRSIGSGSNQSVQRCRLIFSLAMDTTAICSSSLIRLILVSTGRRQAGRQLGCVVLKGVFPRHGSQVRACVCSLPDDIKWNVLAIRRSDVRLRQRKTTSFMIS